MPNHNTGGRDRLCSVLMKVQVVVVSAGITGAMFGVRE